MTEGPGAAAARWRPVAGRLIVAAGAAVTLASMFLPWYSISLRIRSYAELSTFATVHARGAALVCDPPGGHGCHLSAHVGALAEGIGNWRTLIALGTAGLLLFVVLRAMRPGRDRSGHWRVLTALAVATAGLALAAILIGPVGPAGLAGPSQPAALPGLDLDLASSAANGAFVALAGAFAAVAGALLTAPWTAGFRRRGATATTPRLPAPDGPA